MVKTIMNAKAMAEIISEYNNVENAKVFEMACKYSLKVGYAVSEKQFYKLLLLLNKSNLPIATNWNLERVIVVNNLKKEIAKKTETVSIHILLSSFTTDKLEKEISKFLKDLAKSSADKKYEELKNGEEFEAHSIGNEVVKLLKKKYFKYTCECCGAVVRNPKVMELHHIQPVEYGGIDSLDNLACVCRNCHGTIHGFGLEKTEETNYESSRDFFEDIVKPAVKKASNGLTKKQIDRFVDKMLKVRIADNKEEVA